MRSESAKNKPRELLRVNYPQRLSRFNALATDKPFETFLIKTFHVCLSFQQFFKLNEFEFWKQLIDGFKIGSNWFWN